MKLKGFALLLILAVSCQGDRVSTPPHERDVQVSEPLLIALGQVRNYHHLADVHLADGNPQAAIDAVWKVLEVPFPAGAPEAEATALDARARLGKLYLAAGRVVEAERVVNDGIAAAKRESFFLANLYTVKAEIHEAKGEKHEAIEALGRSIEINKQLQAELLKEGNP